MKNVFTLRIADKSATTIQITISDEDAARDLSQHDFLQALHEHHRDGSKAVFHIVGYEVAAYVINYQAIAE